jgi:glycosyltransferase involved in cell wall biosynthesis
MWALGSGEASYWEVEETETGTGKREGAKGVNVRKWESSKVAKVCEQKRKFPVTLTAPSRWLAELTGTITGHSCQALPNPIDLEVYRPGNREQARQRLGLPAEAFLVLAGADSLDDGRKGFDLLRAAWAGLKSRKASLVLFGRHGLSQPGTRYLGALDSDVRMIDAYQAADLYVHPARIENASCQIQEAMACGIPALAFATGGNPELIRPGETGFLACPVSAEGLTAELGRALQMGPELEAMGQAARKQALTIWDSRRLVRAWEEAVEPLFTARPPPRSRG